MKFELNPYNRNLPNEYFLNDLRSIATKLGLNSLSIEEYSKHGKYHPSTLTRRFGSWTKAVTLAGLQIRKNPKIDSTVLLEDLKRVACVLNKKSVTVNEYKSLGKYDSQPFIRAFGSWFIALEKTGLNKTRTLGVTNEQYFENLKTIWTKLGRQPNYAEIIKPFSKYCAGAYERRFGTWRKALEAFIRYINEGENEPVIKKEVTIPISKSSGTEGISHKTKRNINWRLQFIVLRRDNFKCIICGKSPAKNPEVELHVDHIKAWVKGGETTLDNLQMLCSVCNIGKSDLDMHN